MPRKSNTYDFIEKSKKIHGDKYDYSKVKYINNKTKVCIICQIHGEFWQTPDAHLRGCGCKLCGYTNSKEKQKKTNFKTNHMVTIGGTIVGRGESEWWE